MDQTADGEMRHQEAVELLAHQIWGLAAQNDPGAAQMGFELTKRGLDFPALMVERRQLGGGCLLMIQEAGHQPIDRLGIGNTVQAVVDDTNLDPVGLMPPILITGVDVASVMGPLLSSSKVTIAAARLWLPVRGRPSGRRHHVIRFNRGPI